MKRIAALSLLFILVTALLLPAVAPVHGGTLKESVPAPEFTHEHPDKWLNSEPLKLADLRGKVVLLDFWTFECWNCYRSFPWVKALEARLESKGFQVIGVHSPEFEREKRRENVVQKIGEFGLKHPVMLDNDFSYWKAFGNRYWPAWYILDKKGNVRAAYAGETHEGDARAVEIERIIATLLAEPPSDSPTTSEIPKGDPPAPTTIVR